MTDTSSARAPNQTAKCQIKIGGMRCSFCVESIRKAYSRMDGVLDVGVSLSQEEALVQYDPEKLTPAQLQETLRAIGYTVRDPARYAPSKRRKPNFESIGTGCSLRGRWAWVHERHLGGRRPGLVPVPDADQVIFGVGGPILKMAGYDERPWCVM